MDLPGKRLKVLRCVVDSCNKVQNIFAFYHMPETVITYRDSKPCSFSEKALIMLRHDFKVGEDSIFIQKWR